MRVVGTSVDPVARLERFKEKYDLKFDLVGDGDRSIGVAYGTLKSDVSGPHERDTVLIDTDGTILIAYQRVSAKGHAAQVLCDVRRLREEGRI